MINIVGLGYGSIGDLTVQTLKMLKNMQNIFIKGNGHPVMSELMDEGIKFKDYKELYNNIERYSEPGEDAIYAVCGNPLEDEETIKHLLSICEEKNINYKIYAAAGIKAFIQECAGRLMGKVEVINSLIIENKSINKRNEIVITNLFNKDIAKKVKAKLLKIYYDDINVYSLKIGNYKRFDKIKIKDIDSLNDLNELTMIYIPRNSESRKDIYDLIDIVEILRSENGCPWDKEQTHESIKKDIVEESYEVFDAIEQKSRDALVEELGDVLFQIIFHVSLGTEKNEFDILDITDGICNKMIYRHPHVFGNVNVENASDVIMNWDKLKKIEKNFESLTDELKGVAKALPALIRAGKIQKKARKVGFDWDNVDDAIEKVKEEINEVIDVYKSEKMVKIKEEIGDLLFSCVNVSRFLNVDAEEALNLTTDKFIKRFNYIEKKAEESNINLEEMSLSDMDKLWDEAKKLENK